MIDTVGAPDGFDTGFKDMGISIAAKQRMGNDSVNILATGGLQQSGRFGQRPAGAGHVVDHDHRLIAKIAIRQAHFNLCVAEPVFSSNGIIEADVFGDSGHPLFRFAVRPQQ